MKKGNLSAAVQRPRQWITVLYEKYAHEIIRDFRVDCWHVKDNPLHKKELVGVKDKFIGQVGGLWHSGWGRYITESELIDEQKQGYGTGIDPKQAGTEWFFSRVQVELFFIVISYALGQDDIPIQEVFAIGGRRTGKTEAAVRAAIALSLIFAGTKGDVWGYDFINNIESVDGIRVKIEEILPTGLLVDYDKKHKKLSFLNGSTVQFKSANRPGTGRSGAPHWVVFDEPSAYKNPRAVFDIVLPSCAENAAPVFGITTPKGYDAVHYELSKRKRSERLAKAIRRINFGSMYDNPFLTEKSIKFIETLAISMSKAQFKQEILGEYINIVGAVFYDFTEEDHLVDESPAELRDITRSVTKELFGKEFAIIGGMDFNESPTTFVAFVMLENGVMYCYKEILQNNTNVMKFATTLLIPWLCEQFPNMDRKRALDQLLIIGDASGQWQEYGKQAKDGKKEIAAFSTLKSLGLNVIPPKWRNPRSKRFRRTANPDLGCRMESARTRLHSVTGNNYIMINSDCEHVTKMMKEQDLKKSLPNKTNENIHVYDAFTYPFYRIFTIRDVGLDKLSGDQDDNPVFEIIRKNTRKKVQFDESIEAIQRYVDEYKKNRLQLERKRAIKD